MEAAHHQEVYVAGQLEIRPGESLALAAGRPLTFSVREFAVLCVLARKPDRIVSREELCEAVWHQALRPGDRSVDVYVHKVRSKLEAVMPAWRFIHTHIGFGYRFSAEPSQLLHTDATDR